MSIDISDLYDKPRLLIEAELRVAEGFRGRFQPTGFPDLGPAIHKGLRREQDKVLTVDTLLVESAQSIANWLEAVCLDGDDYNADCRGIPYVRVLDGHNKARFLTSSVLEPHRLASDYVLDAKNGGGVYKQELSTALGANKARPVYIPSLVPEIFRRDPGCVLHGVFLERIDGRIRLPRLVSASIDAADPQQVNSGGVYRGQVTAKDNIPYPRQEFTSEEIRASFVLHLGTLRGYRLGERPQTPALENPQGRWTNEEAFLILWGLYKIDRFLHGYLRLRTACEFELVSMNTAPELKGGWPTKSDIQTAFKSVTAACFPELQDDDDWKKRRVQVLTYAVEISGESKPLPDTIKDEAFNLEGFEGRAEVKETQKGKGQSRRQERKLALSGDWQDEEDRARLLEQNPKVQDDEQPNPAHEFIQQALKDWDTKLKKQRGEQPVEAEGDGN